MKILKISKKLYSSNNIKPLLFAKIFTNNAGNKKFIFLSAPKAKN
ncbi:hypothetical protein [Candidatus Pelagibacter sp.]